MFENKFVSLPSHLKTIEPMEVHRGAGTMCNTKTSKVISSADPMIQNDQENRPHDSLTVELPDGINDATGQTPHIVRIFSIGGKPRKELQKGVNIVLMSDGTINKVLIK